jgi:cobyrinic acid a,c-diamide synthase
MCGVFAGTARFTKRLTLGYRDAVAAGDSSLYSLGHQVVGHEFHRTQVEFDADHQPAWTYRVAGDTVLDGAIRNGVHASYLHTHPAGQPTAVRRFVESAVTSAVAGVSQ